MEGLEYPLAMEVAGRLDSYAEGISEEPDALQSPQSNG